MGERSRLGCELMRFMLYIKTSLGVLRRKALMWEGLILTRRDHERGFVGDEVGMTVIWVESVVLN